MNITNAKIHFLGDSITVGHGASEYSRSYVGRFIEKYPNAVIRSYCIGGSCISDGCIWGVESMYDRIDRMDPDADLIVTFGGSNDYECGVPIGTPQDRTIDTFYGGCHCLLEKLQGRFPGKPIVVVTPIHRRNEDKPFLAGAPHAEYVAAVRAVAQRFGFPVIDLNLLEDFCTEPVGRGEALTIDGLHPNDEGYALIFQEMDRFLQAF